MIPSAAILALFLAPLPASSGVPASEAPSNVAVHTGQSLTLTMAADPVVEQAVNAAPTPFEKAVADMASASMFPDAQPAADAGHMPVPEPIAANKVSVKLIPIVDGRGTLMVLQNGYSQAFAYSARIYVKGTAQPMVECSVSPGKREFESWPFPVERIELSAIRLDKWDGAEPHCDESAAA